MLPLALLASLTAAPLLPAENVQVTADEIRYVDGVAHASGHVRVTTPDLVLHAPALAEDTARHQLVIEGPLFAVDGLNVLVARRAVVDLGSGALELFDLEIHQKEKLSPLALAKAETPADAAALGHDRVVIYGKRLTRTGPAHYRIDGLQLTPCECSGGCTPAWSLTSSHSDVLAGERAWLTWPVFRVGDVPVLPLPVLYIPLSDRRTGFLLPHLAWQGQNSLILDEPFFLTLGRSYDATFGLAYIFGEKEGTPGAGAGPGLNGVAGPRANLEFRYNPSRETAGRASLMLLEDLHHDFDAAGTPYQRGLRESLRWWHLEGDDGRWGDRVDLALVSDAKLTNQLTTDILFASVPATRSAATAFWRGDDWLFTVDAVYYQDFQGAFSPDNPHELLYGAGSPRTVATVPRLQADLDDRKLGPLWFSWQSSAARQAPVGSSTDLVTLGCGGIPGCGGLTVAQPGRSGADRLDLLPALAWPVDFGRFATFSLRASWREDLWLFESPPLPGEPGQTGQRGYPLVDLSLGTKLARSWASGWFHSIAPQVELRGIPALESSGIVPPLWLIPALGRVYDHATGLPIATALPLPYDEVDFAPGLGGAPVAGSGGLQQGTLPTSLAQGELHVDQRLRGPHVSVRLDVGEYVDQDGPVATYGVLASNFWQFHFNAYAAYANRPPPCPPACSTAAERLGRLEEASADAGWADARGDAAGLSFVRAIAAGSARLNAPLDALFAPPLSARDPRWALPDISQLTASAAASLWGGVSVHGGLTYLVPAAQPIQILAGAGYRSPQHCLTLDGSLVLQPPQPGLPLTVAAFFVTFDLGEIGGGGSF